MRCLRRLVSVTFILHILVGAIQADDITSPTTRRTAVLSRYDEPEEELDGISQTSMKEYFQSAMDACQQTAAEPCQPQSSCFWNLTGGGSFYYLRPFAEGNVAYQRTTITTAPVGNTSTAVGQTVTQNFDWNTQPAGAFWLGTANENGLGIQSRFFFLSGNSQNALVSLTPDQASSSTGPFSTVTNVINPSPYTPPTFPGALPPVVAGSQSFSSPSQLLAAPGGGVGRDDMVFRSSLRINALDLEPTYGWKTDRWSFLAGAGLRYLQLQQTYGASLQNLGGGAASEFETLNLSNKFWGVGPTLSGRFTRNLGATGLKLFTSGRGSYLVGNSSRLASLTDTLNDPQGLTTGVPNTFVQRNSLVPTSTDMNMAVLDLELGLEYGKVLKDHYWYCRGAMVDQTYFNAGNASNTTGNLSLFGFQFSAGVDF